MASVSRQMSGKPTNRPSGITSGFPVIRPESMPSADITSYKPTSQDLSRRRSRIAVAAGLRRRRPNRCKFAVLLQHPPIFAPL
jgi:hypothetical protein